MSSVAPGLPSELPQQQQQQQTRSGARPASIFGVDFTSRPCARKPIAVAVGTLLPAGHLQASDVQQLTAGSPGSLAAVSGAAAATPPPPPQPAAAAAAAAAPVLQIEAVLRFATQPAFQSWLLEQQAPFVAALDFPFGQPREAAEALGWVAGATPAASAPASSSAASSAASQGAHANLDQPNPPATRSDHAQWLQLLHASALTLAPPDFEAALRCFMAGQPPGRKHLRRRVAAWSGETSPMSLVRTPTAKMFHAGAQLLAAAADAGCHVPPHTPPPAPPLPPMALLGGDGAGSASADGGDGRPGVRLLRVLVEGYPALPARHVLRAGGGSGGRGGATISYKGDGKDAAADPRRAEARRAILAALQGFAEPQGAATAGLAADGVREQVQVQQVQQAGDAGGAARGRSASLASTPAPSATRRGKRRAETELAEQRAGSGGGGGARTGAARASLPAAYGLARVRLAAEVAEACVADGSGDTLDAVLAAVQAAWAAGRGRAGGFGVPPDADPVEGWVADPAVWEGYCAAASAAAAAGGPAPVAEAGVAAAAAAAVTVTAAAGLAQGTGRRLHGGAPGTSGKRRTK